VTSKGGGFLRRVSREGRREDEVVRTKFIAAIAFAISIACSLFNVMAGDSPRLSGSVLVGARAIGGWH
jgi:hypothetical protein